MAKVNSLANGDTMMASKHADNDFAVAQNAVLKHSVPLPKDTIQIKGYDFNDGIDYEKMLDLCLSTGFQASNLARAIELSGFFFWSCHYKRLFAARPVCFWSFRGVSCQ